MKSVKRYNIILLQRRWGDGSPTKKVYFSNKKRIMIDPVKPSNDSPVLHNNHKRVNGYFH